MLKNTSHFSDMRPAYSPDPKAKAKYRKNNDTTIIFISNNKSEGHDFDDTWPDTAFPARRKNLLAKQDFSYENMGRENAYTFDDPK